MDVHPSDIGRYAHFRRCTSRIGAATYDAYAQARDTSSDRCTQFEGSSDFTGVSIPRFCGHLH